MQSPQERRFSTINSPRRILGNFGSGLNDSRCCAYFASPRVRTGRYIFDKSKRVFNVDRSPPANSPSVQLAWNQARACAGSRSPTYANEVDRSGERARCSAWLDLGQYLIPLSRKDTRLRLLSSSRLVFLARRLEDSNRKRVSLCDRGFKY